MSLMDKIKNKLQMSKGRTQGGRRPRRRRPVPQGSEGRSDRVAGGAKQAGEHVKDAGKNIRDGFKK